MPLKAKDLERALLAKGFERDNRDHLIFVLMVNGVKQDVHTKISHGERDIHDKNLGLIRRQMGKLTADEFNRFVDCQMSGADYVQMLTRERALDEVTPWRPVWERRRSLPE